MMFKFDTLNHDPKKFIDKKPCLGDIGVVLTQGDLDLVPVVELPEEAEKEDEEGEANA